MTRFKKEEEEEMSRGRMEIILGLPKPLYFELPT
jgi:hypothetical protein